MTKEVINANLATGRSGRPSNCIHPVILETATAMAHELYDTMMQDNEWYKSWKHANPGASAKALESRFVKRNLDRLVPQARATLASMLPTISDESLRQTIYDALLLDATLVRPGAPVGLGAMN